MASVASSSPDPRHLQLITASAQANETRVREILAEDAHWTTLADRDALRQSLQKVAGRGNLTIARLLLELGAEVEPRRDSEVPALFKAAEAGHVSLVSELLAHGANPDAQVRSRLNQTALFPASFRGHNKVVSLLLAHGANVHIRDKEGRPVFMFLVSEKASGRWTTDTLRLLVEDGGANPELRDATGRTPLLWAATNGNTGLVDCLLDGSLGRRIADVSAANNRGRSALHLAAEANHEEMVKLLLKHHPDPNAISDGGWTALHNAAQNGHANVVSLLLAAGAFVNAELSNGMTPLHWAAFNGHEEVVKLLLTCDETNVEIKDSFDRTPMLCAAERFHRDIVHLLSPIHAAARLSPAAREACREFKATVVDFGNFRDGKRHLVMKKSVFDVLYGWDKDTNKPTVATQTKNIKYQPEFRWIHLPANNIAWVETLLSKWFIEGGHRDIEPFKALEKCFDQEHRGPLAHAHFMRTFCHRIPSLQPQSTPTANDFAHGAQPTLVEEPTSLSTASTARPPSVILERSSNTGDGGGGSSGISGSETTPKKPARDGKYDENGGGTPRSDTQRKKGKGELIAERHPRRAKRRNGIPDNPPGTKALKARAAQGPGVLESSQLPSTNGKIVLFMPFLHYETDERRQSMSRAVDLIRQGWEPPIGSSKDVMLVKGYLCNTPPLHPRRTLDQFFYHGIDTSIRDTDQVVYRYCKRHNVEKKVFMVDQLWLWVLGHDLVITCFPQRWSQPNRDPLNVVDGIIEETNAKTRPPIQSVYDLSMLITNRCSGMFDRYRLADQDYQFLDMFESSIGLVTNTESELFSRFNKASELSAEWLELHRRPKRRNTADPLASTFSSSPSLTRLAGVDKSAVPTTSVDTKDDVGGIDVGVSVTHSTEQHLYHDHHDLPSTVPVFPDALLDIGTETSLLAEIKDIRDELNILNVVLGSQRTTLEEFETNLMDELRPDGVPPSRRGGLGGMNGSRGGANHHGYVPAGSGNYGSSGGRSLESVMAEIRKRARDQKRVLEIHQKDIDRMDRQAESIYISLTHLLDLKQKHSNALEARFARDHAVIAARQGQTIMTFTIVTIIFLPMSFIAAFFSMQIKEWEDNLTLGYVSKYLFGIGLGISIPLVIMAFTVADIYDAVYGFFGGIHTRGQKTRWSLSWLHRRQSTGTRDSNKTHDHNGAPACSDSNSLDMTEKLRQRSQVLSRVDSGKLKGHGVASAGSNRGRREETAGDINQLHSSYGGDRYLRLPQIKTQQQQLLQPHWAPVGLRPEASSLTASAVAAASTRKRSAGSGGADGIGGRGWTSFERTRMSRASDDLEMARDSTVTG